MKSSAELKTESAATTTMAIMITKVDMALPLFIVLSATSLAIRAGTQIAVGGRTVSFPEQTLLALPELAVGPYVAAIKADDSVEVSAAGDGDGADSVIFGGFYFAPGGNAPARAGGDTTPAINPVSCWDECFRPAAPSPHGMRLVVNSPGAPWLPAFWEDINPLCVEHLDGTSQHGQKIADGRNKPRRIDGNGYYDNLNYYTAVEILAHHGKQVPSDTEFRAAAYGVTEASSAGTRVETTGLDAARTSRSGGMMETGHRWCWGNDGDPDKPRAVLLGGAWANGAVSGSRASYWGALPSSSNVGFGARGRCDHLQLA